jgi:UPF0176 protein
MTEQVNDNESKELLSTIEDEESSNNYRILAFYKFVSPRLPRDSLKDLQAEIENKCRELRTRGTVLLAEEGINGTICYPFEDSSPSDDPLLEFLQSKFENLRIRMSKSSHGPVFARLKVKIKVEIVTMHQEVFPAECVGTYVKPDRWNELLEDPDCLVIDTRNEYEVQVGTFRNAVNPKTQSFIEFPDWMRQQVLASQHDNSNQQRTPKKIAMFCTGGIRCEKATSAALQLVPKDVPVYHLAGGILAYLDNVPKESSLFDGECYVFDQRIAVTHGLAPSAHYNTSCYACRHPLSAEDVKRDDYVKGLHCRWCMDQLTEKQKERFNSRQRQIELAAKKGLAHMHDPKEIL